MKTLLVVAILLLVAAFVPQLSVYKTYLIAASAALIALCAINKEEFDLQDEEYIRSILSSKVQSAAEYNDMVQKLSTMDLTDPKIQGLLQSFGDTPIGKLKMIETVARASDLLPTQNEIDISKSLAFPLKDEKFNSLVKYLKWKEGDAPATFPQAIVIGGPDGRDIIDGHHRWSQVYAINPNVEIKVLQIVGGDTGLEMLKSTQLCIAAASKSIKSELVKGDNILSPQVGADKITRYIDATIKPKVVAGVAELIGSDSIGAMSFLKDKIVANLMMMRSMNRPRSCAPGEDINSCAPPRAYMPQTDDAGVWKQVCQM